MIAFLAGLFVGIVGMSLLLLLITREIELYHQRRVRLMRQNAHWALANYYRWGTKR